ncbi:hypothetical protein ABE493_08295 [Stenotrophomonas terrae]|uniref:hypothetical protein n=1 Tax=Stenotrophomonas terrae TaxID=405446 RepID=UPI00320B6343
MKGPTSKGIERRQRDISSIKCTLALLSEAVTDPANFISDRRLHSAVSSQGALAKLADDRRSIIAMSLNHQRKVAEELPGGFLALDRLRRAVKSALEQQSTREHEAGRTNKAALRARIVELEALILSLRQDLIIVQRAYDHRCAQARSYAKGASAAIRALCEKEQREIEATFSLRSVHSTQNEKVVSIKTARPRAPQHG